MHTAPADALAAAVNSPNNVATGATLTPDRELYPPIEPYETGMLDVGDGQQIYWETSGNPDGIPAVFVHGGPGGGGGTDQRRFFDPEVYRIVVFDQRGCGRSLPHASAPDADLSTNTTWHSVADLEAIREHLGIDRWLVFGGSWGSCLALAYAQTHTDRVLALVLRGIFTLRRSELDWYYNEGASHLFPEWWDSYCAPLVKADYDLDSDKIAAYNKLLWHEDPAVALEAGLAWSIWEAGTSSLFHDAEKVADYHDPHYALAFARIENHYFHNGGFMDDGQLIANAPMLAEAGIPGIIIQGRYDMPCPVVTSYDLHKAWPEADYKIVLAGHGAFEPNIAAELVKATDHFGRVLSGEVTA